MKDAKKKTARGGNPGRRGQVNGPDHENNVMIAHTFEPVKVPIYDLMPRETPDSWNAKAARINRKAELDALFWAETNEEETQEWRENLTSEEAEMVAAWDVRVEQGMVRLCRDILRRS